MAKLTQIELNLGYCEEAQTYCSVAEERYKLGRQNAIDELLEKMRPCENCPSYPNECNHTEYFQDCCVTEKTISFEDIINFAEQVKAHWS